MSKDSPKQSKTKKPFSLAYALAFVVATIAITEFFTSYHYFEDGKGFQGMLVVAISLGALVVSLVYMAFRIYMDEKKDNNLRKSFFFFDWLETKFNLGKENYGRN